MDNKQMHRINFLIHELMELDNLIASLNNGASLCFHIGRTDSEGRILQPRKMKRSNQFAVNILEEDKKEIIEELKTFGLNVS